MQCLYALTDIISTGLRACARALYSILGRAKRPYVDLKICINTLVLMCVTVNGFVCEDGCVCLNLDSLRQRGLFPQCGVWRRNSWENKGGDYRLHVPTLSGPFYTIPTMLTVTMHHT